MSGISDGRKATVVRFFLERLKKARGGSNYDVWLPERSSERDIYWECAVAVLQTEPPPPYTSPSSGFGIRVIYGEESRETQVAKELAPLIYDITWQLCLMGVLRPGVRTLDAQVFGHGQGYSLIAKGRAWVEKCVEEETVSFISSI